MSDSRTFYYFLGLIWRMYHPLFIYLNSKDKILFSQFFIRRSRTFEIDFSKKFLKRDFFSALEQMKLKCFRFIEYRFSMKFIPARYAYGRLLCDNIVQFQFLGR